MINAIATADFGSPRDFRVLYPDDFIGEEVMASERQKNILTNLIMERIYSEEQREKWFSQINSLTSSDCEEEIFELLTAWTVIK